MKFNFRTGVVLGTIIAAAAADDCYEEKGNYYCTSVQAIAYSNFGVAGSYDQVTSMANGQCSSTKQSSNGGMAPLNGEVSLESPL